MITNKWQKYLKENCDKDDKEEVQEITDLVEFPWQKRPVCETCNQTFETKYGLKKT